MKKNDEEILMGNNKRLLKDEVKSTEKTLNAVLDILSRNKNKKSIRMIDIAAGNGRLIKKVFIKYFNKIDAVEPTERFHPTLNMLKKANSQVKKIYKYTAQEFIFEKKYDLIFNLGLFDNLTDIQYLQYLIKVRKALKKNGIIFAKENTRGFYSSKFYSENLILKDTFQRVRYVDQHLLFFKLVGLRPIISKLSDNYPEGYLPMYEFVLERED